jgi:hypothetical protein
MAGGTTWLSLGAAATAVLAGVMSFAAFSRAPELTADSPEFTTTSTAVVPAEAFYISPTEVAVGPAVLVPSALSVESGAASLAFELHHLTPTQDVPPGGEFVSFRGWQAVDAADITVVYPDVWTIVIDGQDVSGAVANPQARAARFIVPSGSSAADVDAVRMNGYRLRVPIDQPFAFDRSVSSASAAPGVTATLVQVSEQPDSTIVRVELAIDYPHDANGIDVVGSGPGWLGSVREAEGGLRWNLTFAGSAPERIELRLRGSLWLHVNEEIEIDLGGLHGG